MGFAVTRTYPDVKEVVVIKVKYENFLKSLCDAFKSGVFLWGLKNEGERNKVLEVSSRLAIFYVIERGFTMIATVKGSVDDSRPYWPDEVEEGRIIYGFRFLLEPVKISSCFSSGVVCGEGKELSAGCFVESKMVNEYIARECRLTGTRRQALIAASPTKKVSGCDAEKLVEYLMRRLTDFKPVSDPIFDKLRDMSLDKLVVLAHLMAGKNVLLLGPPGSGKTSFLTRLLEDVGVDYSVETGNPEWTPFDTIGGQTIHGGVVKGFVTKSVERCESDLSSKKLPYWLIVDEINRANVDLAFGKLFTLLDPVYRDREKLPVANNEVRVPLSFRVLATMNSFDRALLHKMGYALMRRFAIVRHEDLNMLESPASLYGEVGAVDEVKKYARSECLDELRIGLERVKSELLMSSVNDYLVISPTLHKILSSRQDPFSVEGLELHEVLACISRDIINEKLKNYTECEVCPIRVTPGVLADALKYVAVLNTLIKETGRDLGRELTIKLVLDTALASYILPQLDVLADRAQLEAISGKQSKLENILKEISGDLGKLGLKLSSELVGRLAGGRRII
jgi:hypothetical protein